MNVKDAVKAYGPRLRRLPQVVGVGWGPKLRRGQPTGDMGLVVMVQKKLPISSLKTRERIPQDLDGLLTDVQEVGEIRALSRLNKSRPAPPGVSIGHTSVTAGTFGAVAYDIKTGTPVILSNNHVLANETNGSDGRAGRGDLILQPGSADGGQEADAIGRLEKFVPIYKTDRAPDCEIAKRAAGFMNALLAILLPRYRMSFHRLESRGNVVDAAVARPIDPSAIRADILEIGVVRGTTLATLDLEVQKSGRTTGLTRGRVRAVNLDLRVGMGVGSADFEDQIAFDLPSGPGDSGSLILDLKNRAVALLFAGNGQITIGNPIAEVLDRLDLRF